MGHLGGLPIEGWSHREIERVHHDGLTDIDPREAHRPLDDVLAQAVHLGEALLDSADYVTGFAGRLVTWARENGRCIGRLEEEHVPPIAARMVYMDRMTKSESTQLALPPVCFQCSPD